MHSIRSLVHRHLHRGASLIEVLLALSIVSALFNTVSSKFDIADIFWKLGKTGQQTAVRAIGSAIKRYDEDHAGKLPGASPGNPTMITDAERPLCKQEVPEQECKVAGGVSLSELIDGGKYLLEIPIDQKFNASSELMTGYRVQILESGRVKVTAQTNSGVTFTY